MCDFKKYIQKIFEKPSKIHQVSFQNPLKSSPIMGHMRSNGNLSHRPYRPGPRGSQGTQGSNVLPPRKTNTGERIHALYKQPSVRRFFLHSPFATSPSMSTKLASRTNHEVAFAPNADTQGLVQQLPRAVHAFVAIGP